MSVKSVLVRGKLSSSGQTCSDDFTGTDCDVITSIITYNLKAKLSEPRMTCACEVNEC